MKTRKSKKQSKEQAPMTEDDYLRLQRTVFKTLQDIMETQMQLNRTVKHLSDYNEPDIMVVYDKIKLRLTILNNARMTCETILKNIKNISGLEEAVAELQRMVNE